MSFSEPPAPNNASEATATPESLSRAAGWLSAAGFLLARRAPLVAVHALHSATAHQLRPPAVLELPDKYASARDAEEHHRRLLDEVGASRERTLRRCWRTALLSLLPQLTSWLVVLAVVGGMTLIYGVGVLKRTRWKHEHPEGNWISRYYWNRKFAGTPLLRYDTGINYNWGRKAPAAAMLRDNWSARWDTCLIVHRDTSLALTLVSDDSSKLIVDDAVEIQIKKPAKKKAQVLLRAGVRHLRVDFLEGPGNAVVRLDGLNFSGTDSYEFRRPTLMDDEVHCEDSLPAALSSGGGDASTP